MRPELALALLLALSTTSCRSAMPVRSTWSGAVDLKDGVSVPFQMELDFSGPQATGFFLNGGEITSIPEIARTDQSIALGFSEYGAVIRAAWDGRQLTGNYLRIRSNETKAFPFTATPEPDRPAQTHVDSEIAQSLVGNYRVLFENDGKTNDSTLAKFWKEGDSIQGTFIAPDGDYGLLAATHSGDTIQLSRFTGWQAIALVLNRDNGTWSGAFHAASDAKPRRFTLQPRGDLQIEAPAPKRAVMKNRNGRFEFSGISTSGEVLRDSDDRFKGKALIVDIMGTWCHNCLDEAPILQQLQEKYGNDGLQVIGLSFEISSDPAIGRKNLQLFRNRFHLTYPLLFCGSTDDENFAKQINKQIENFFAYPTTIFIDKNHRVVAVHSGFRGPGTGDEFQSQIREFDELAARLVKQP